MNPDVEDIYELSPLQQGMLFESLRTGDTGLYCEQICLDLAGNLDLQKFAAAWKAVIQRHHSLRAAMQWEELDKPYQVVFTEVSLPWVQEDWTGLDPSDIESRFEKWLAADRRRGIVLSEPPLFRFTLFHLPGGTCRFVWSVHHILLDGWSWPLVIREVLAFYTAACEGREAALPRPGVYRDFIEWLQSQDLDQAKVFWQNHLRDLPSPAQVAMKSSNLSEHSAYAREFLTLPEEETAQLAGFAQKHQLTLNTLCQAAWGLLLCDYSSQTDVVFGSVVSGRPSSLASAETTVGLFVNTLPVRARFTPEDVVVPWLKQWQLQQLEAREFEYTPLAEVQRWAKAQPNTPLFESIYAFENYPFNAARDSVSGLQVSNVRAFHLTNYPLTVAITPNPQFTVELIYDQTVYDTDSAQRILRNFQTLLLGLTEDPNRRLCEVRRLSEADRELVLSTWASPSTSTSSRPGATLHNLFREQAAAAPGKVAAVCKGQTITYRDLDLRSNQVARYLRDRGVQQEEPVGVLMERSIDAIVALLGILKAGGAYVALDPDYPQQRLDFLLEDSGTRHVLTRSGRSIPEQTGRVAIDIGDGEILNAAHDPVEDWSGPDNLAMLVYTSGSTGRPKGVCVLHRGCVRLVLDDTYAVSSPDQVGSQIGSMAFDASTFEIWWPLLNGHRLAIFPDKQVSVQELAEAIVRERVTSLFLTTALFNLMADNAIATLTPVQQIIFGGEAVSPAHVERVRTALPQCRLIHAYGPTENTTYTTCYTVPRPDGRKLKNVPIGRPINHTSVYVVDRDLRPVAPGVPGELLTGGEGLARGYWRRPEITDKAFISSPHLPGERLYRTGDLVRWLPDGVIEFIGRIDDQVKIRGFRIEPSEIEAVISDFRDVDTVVVVAREDQPGDRRLAAYFTSSATTPPTEKELKERLRTLLPDHMVPAHLILLNQLPLSPNGKVDRRALPKPQVGEAAVSSPDALVTETEGQIAAIWKELLHVESLGREDNFFDLGGHSLSLMQVHSRLQTTWPDLKLVELFQHPTIRALARRLTQPRPRDTRAADVDKVPKREPIAVVAMTGRFPGANSVEQLWNNLRDGIESVRAFTDEELRQSNIPETLLSDPAYVKAGATIDNVSMFDAQFFGFNPREAELTDPQHRLFLECAHEALELAGCDPLRTSGAVGVYAGASMSSYLPATFYSEPGGKTSRLQLLIGNDKDFLASRVAYKLNLRGPAVVIQTACSTSLVAVHTACEALLAGDCDMALAGGVSISLPQVQGYLHVNEGIASPDGHCRAFDAGSNGTVGGQGVAIVALKRLSDARRDGNLIHAVIRGSAINNDGSNKVGYTAPSVDGQAAVIRAAHSKAGVEPRSITCIETHGTGTHLGDVIEIAALKRAFGDGLPVQSCAIGSLKTNLGHLDAAAGVAGLIKGVLQLKHSTLLPSLNFQSPNPKLGLETSPFYVNSVMRAWPDQDGPRRAGVSSFGIGGTNAHVVLEEAPRRDDEGVARPWQIMTVSAKSPEALRSAAANLADHLSSPNVPLADTAFTAATGRTAHPYRLAVVGNAAPSISRSLESQMDTTAPSVSGSPSVAFLFPGQGAQYPGMGSGLYYSEPSFRERIDRCAELLRPDLNGDDVRDFLLARNVGDTEDLWTRTDRVQPALFVLEYALASLFMDWGLHPSAMIGHSLGEYVAACIAGVYSLEDALQLVALRGRIMQDLPAGAMIAVAMSADDATRFSRGRACLAAHNGPLSSVLSGTFDSIERLEAELESLGIQYQRLKTSHAFHSRMMEPALDQFTKAVRALQLRAPSLPYVSNVTGKWIQPEEATDATYWTRHLRETVRISDGFRTLLERENLILIEIGPGHTLSSLCRRQPLARDRQLFTTLPAREEPVDQAPKAYQTLAQLWTLGAPVSWEAFYRGERRQFVDLPTYPFQRERFWIEPVRNTSAVLEPSAEKSPAEWLYVPSWRRSLTPAMVQARPDAVWLITGNPGLLGEALETAIRQSGRRVISAPPEASERDLADLLHSLQRDGSLPEVLIHFTSSAASDPAIFFGPLYAACGLAAVDPTPPCRMLLVTTGAVEVTGAEAVDPRQALTAGPRLVIPQEYPSVFCSGVDLDPQPRSHPEEVAACLVAEATSTAQEFVAYRHRHRWVQTMEPLQISESAQTAQIRNEGTYLITGGLGHLGLALAERLARSRARLLLVSRSAFPVPGEWDEWLQTRPADHPISVQIARLRRMESMGARVITITADVADPESIKGAIHFALERFGALHGVIHGAAATNTGFGGIGSLDESDVVTQFRPKVDALPILERALAGLDLDFCVLHSSLAAVAGGRSLAAYASANAYMDSFVHRHNREGGARWITINWDGWKSASAPTQRDRAIGETEGADLFETILASRLPQVMVSTIDLPSRLVAKTGPAPSQPDGQLHSRPDLLSTFAAPRNSVETSIIQIWQTVLGIGQVGIHDSFFDLGGDSLLATQVLSRMRDLLSIHLSLRVFFEGPTVAQLSDCVMAHDDFSGTCTEIGAEAAAVN